MARRVFAAVLATLLLVGVSGAARAIGGESIECCCGRHDAHRACKCTSCPVSKKRKQVGTHVEHARDCDGNAEPGVLAVVAIVPPLPSLAEPAAVPHQVPSLAPLASRLVEAGRPPP